METKNCCPLANDCPCPKLLRLYIYILGTGPMNLTAHLTCIGIIESVQKHADFRGNLCMKANPLKCKVSRGCLTGPVVKV